MPLFPTAYPASDPFRRIREEVEGGLRNHREAIDRARRSLDYYRGLPDPGRYPVRPQGSGKDPSKYPRRSLVMQCAVNTLTANLYKNDPVRTLTDKPAATEWLHSVYRANGVDALWQHADQLATAADVAAFQAVPSEDPRRPVRLVLWDAGQFVVWVDPEDQTKPIAVGVLDEYNEQRRFRLFTDETVVTYTTPELKDGQTAGGRDYRKLRERPNDLGFIPFSFAHFAMPLTDFCTSGPGRYLADVNECFDLILTQNGDRVRFNLNPPIIGQDVPVGWSPPSSPIQPGDIWFPPNAPNAAGERGAPANFSYLQADTSNVTAAWEDIENYLDHVLQMVRVPPAIVRMIQDSARSGESIKAEQAPLVMWAESRQRPFLYYEMALAKLVLSVGARHLGAQDDAEYRATAADLEEAAEDPGLSIRYPQMYPTMPGEERNKEDQWLLDNGLTSRTAILMKREQMTREEAEAFLEEVAEDLERERTVFGGVMPVPLSGEETRDQMKAEQEADGEREPTSQGTEADAKDERDD